MTAPGVPLAIARGASAVAPLNAEPRASSVQLSQLLAGRVMVVVEERGDWLRGYGEDGYGGWTHRGYVTPLQPFDAAEFGVLGPTPADFPETLRPRGGDRISLGCVVSGRGRSFRRALPLGAVIADEDAEVSSGDAVRVDQRARRFPREPDWVVASALELFRGTSYQWGGVTPWGADCSGLVQSVFRLHGVELPRDAWQQAEAGADAGGDAAALRAADLLFFSDRSDGRVTHVGIAVGDGRMVHLALGRGGYAVDAVDGTGDGYTARLMERFRRARRVLDAGT